MSSLVSELKAAHAPPKAFATFCLTDTPSLEKFVEQCQESGPVDTLINCAGVNSARASVSEIQFSDLDWMLDINLKAPLRLIQKVLPSMQERRSGRIVNVLSTVCLFANEGIAAYTASKAALDAATKVLLKEARRFNIAVTSVYPGGVNTAFRSKARPEYSSPESIALAISSLLKLPPDVVPHELVLRPMIEENFL